MRKGLPEIKWQQGQGAQQGGHIKGTGIAAFVIVKESQRAAAIKDPAKFEQELKQHVTDKIGAIARPDEIRFAEALPKTRTGKIMRRLLREIASTGGVVGDITTLEDFSVLESLREEED